MAIEIKGTIHRLFDAKQVSDKFRKREMVVLVEDGKYPQMLLVEVTGDRIDQTAQLREGDAVTCAINLRGREWRSPAGDVKYFNSIEAWRIDVTSQARPALTGADLPGSQNDIPF